MSCKNQRFTKRGLTPYEQGVVERTLADHKARWEWLFDPTRNRWKPSDGGDDLRKSQQVR
jgi:hypothetical protein